MKSILKAILQYYLKYITKLVLLVHQPIIIAIAGSTNKTFVKDEINRVLRKKGELVRSNPKSFNTEIGLPLAILALPSGYSEYKKWTPIIIRATFTIFNTSFPKFLVLELGVSRPGDMKYLLSIIKPKIVVITDITQRYIDSFAGMDELVGEYEYLVKKIPSTGLILLNYDNARIKNMSRLVKIGEKRVEFFGCEDGAKWQAVNIIKDKLGQKVKVSHHDIVHQYSISRFGQHHVYALLVGLIIKEYAFN